MRELDVVILSDAKTPVHKALTDHTIESLIESETGIKFNIVVIESTEGTIYEVPTLYKRDDEKFNFNKFMNWGAHTGKASHIAFCNNDLDFKKGWATEILNAMERHKLDCGSPYCRNARFMKRITPNGTVKLGFEVGMYFAGWCYVMRRDSWEKMGGFDEEFFFWCADNSTVEIMKKHNMYNGLVTSSFVDHIGEATLKDIGDLKEEYTYVQVKKFNKKYNQNLFNLGE